MKYTPSGGRTATGPPAWFTGTVHIDDIRVPDEQSCVSCAHVRFTPGARTAWHTHPRLARPCTSPTASATSHDAARPPQEIRPGDVVYIEPDEEHWHGATADRFMAHVAIQEADQDGQVVTWEHTSPTTSTALNSQPSHEPPGGVPGARVRRPIPGSQHVGDRWLDNGRGSAANHARACRRKRTNVGARRQPA